MLCTPWEDRLISVLTTEPHKKPKVSKQFIQIVNENLCHRRSLRLKPSERSGIDQNPEWCVPQVGYWSGDYQDLPAVVDVEYKVQYNIIFKADGAVEGSGSSSEGSFNLHGVYNSRSGTVAWRQVSASCPVWYNSCSKYGDKVESEFFGTVSHSAGTGPCRITGTFLTDLGRYCSVSLVCHGNSELTTVLDITTRIPDKMKPHPHGTGSSVGKMNAQSNAEVEPPLPTLLAAPRWTPIKDGKFQERTSSFAKRQLHKHQSNDSDTHWWTCAQDEDE